MPLNRDQVAKLYTSGMVTIPSPFPDAGAVSFEQNAYRIGQQDYDVVRVEYRSGPDQTTTTIIRLEDVQAILWATKGIIDPIDGDWSIGSEVAQRLRNPDHQRAGGYMHGIVFVLESAPVLVRSEMAVLAGEIAMRADPGC